LTPNSSKTSVVPDTLDSDLQPFLTTFTPKPEEVKEMLYEGSKKAREIARITLEETIDAMKIRF